MCPAGERWSPLEQTAGDSPAPSSECSTGQRSLQPVWPGGNSGPAALSCIHPETGQARQATPPNPHTPASEPAGRPQPHPLPAPETEVLALQ